MDTDDLTPMAYEVIVQANSILDVLRSEVGASSIKYNDEDSFLLGTLEFIKRKIKSPERYLDHWNYLDEIDVDQFKRELIDLQKFIVQVIDTPLQKRGTPPYE